jgi:hypothetical protein
VFKRMWRATNLKMELKVGGDKSALELQLVKFAASSRVAGRSPRISLGGTSADLTLLT